MAPMISGTLRRYLRPRSGRMGEREWHARALSPAAASAQSRGCGAQRPVALPPEAQATRERIAVGTEPYAPRQALQAHGVAATEHDVVRLERELQLFDHSVDLVAPLPVAESFAAALADVVLEGAAALVGHVPDFGGLDHAVNNDGHAQSRAQPDKQHAPAPVAADCLHGCIVDHLDRLAESLLEVKSDPALAEVVGLRGDPAVEYESRVTDRHGVKAEVAGEFENLAHHAERRHLGPGDELVDRAACIDAQLHVHAADIDDQYV